MLRQVLLNKFIKNTNSKNERDGARVLKNDLISDLNYEVVGNKMVLTSSVISEDLFNEYSCKIDISKDVKDLEFIHCTCDDFEKNSFKKDNYCCKHIVATFYKFLNMVDEDEALALSLGLSEKKKDIIKASQKSVLDFLLKDSSKKESLKFEIILNKSTWNDKINAQFKIGLESMKSSKLYALKDINAFLIAYYNKISLPYGKDFVFNIKEQRLKPKDKKLIKFIEMIVDLDKSYYKRSDEKYISGKTLNMPQALLKEFLLIVCNNRIYLGDGFYSRQIETEIIKDKVPIPMNIKDLNDIIKLEAPRGVPKALNSSEDVFLYDTLIYIPPEEQLETLMPYIEVFSHGNSVFFSKEEEERILKELIPSIHKLTNDIELSPSLSNKIVIAKPNFKFYFDKDEYVYLKLKLIYDNCEFDYFENYTKKIIYRDYEKENKVIEKLRELGFEEVDEKFVFLKNDDYIFNFFKKDILELHVLGEVYYSERFTGIKSINSKSFSGEVRKGKYDYFEFNFLIKDIPEEEINNILRAFRDSKKYYKLDSGEFLDLEEIEFKKFLKLLDALEGEEKIEESSICFNKNKGIYLENYIEDENIKYIKGRKEIKEIKNTLYNLKNIEFEIPSTLKDVLRNYQVKGFNWLNTLDYLGFGGILGDEMGLGKTLQTISFLLSKQGSKTLIIAPTSLIFNWKNEFKKFAPSMEIGIVNSSRDEREILINNYNNFDVLITTYNLCKRDLDKYKEINFDFVILDEAQNIKNSNSQNAKAVKEIKGRTKFALTGTPIENSLMELWSIFDFIMPGYLYDEQRFTTRYHRRLEEDPVIIEEVKKLINPFILRRRKKEVLKELPDKIEKKLVVPMEKEQAKAYAAYADHVKELIENKIKNDEFKNSKIEILSYITKLRQIAIDPSLVMSDYEGGSGKIDALIELLVQSIEEGHKILLFSQFTSALKIIERELKINNISYSYLDGSTPAKNREKIVEEFKIGDNPVFLISLKAGGTGLNLTNADIVIHFDPWWNPAVEDQASDRAHRIGQKNVVEVIKMICEDSIEEKIVNLQEEKRKLIDKVIDEGSLSNLNIDKLSEEDIMFLFSK